MALREGNTRRNTELWLLMLAAMPAHTIRLALYVSERSRTMSESSAVASSALRERKKVSLTISLIICFSCSGSA